MPTHQGEWLTTAEAADALCISISRLRGPLIDIAITRHIPDDRREGVLWLRADVERVLHIRQAAHLGFYPALRVAAAIRMGAIAPQNDTTHDNAGHNIPACARSLAG